MTKRENLNRQLIDWLPTSKDADLVLIAAHFPSTFADIQKHLTERGVEYQLESSELDYLWLERQAKEIVREAVDRQQPKVLLCLCQQLNLQLTNNHRQFHAETEKPRPRISGLVVERHFLRSRDEAVVDFFSRVGWDSRLGFFLALDDSVIQAFSNPALYLLLEHYGLSDQKAVDSPLVAKHVKFSQNQFAKAVALEKGFVSTPAEWISLHCPTLVK